MVLSSHCIVPHKNTSPIEKSPTLSRMMKSFKNYMRCWSSLGRSSSSTEVEDEVVKGKHATKSGGWKCMPYIIGNETFEKLASTGLMANFTVYLVKRFSMKQVAAANLANIFFGTTNFAPLVGAFVSDTYIGRFRTIAYSSVASLLGMVVLTLTAALPQLQTPSCSAAAQLAKQCPGPSMAQMGTLLLSLIFLAIGAAGIRPCSLPFGVDQFDKFTEDGRQGLNSFFNWYYGTSTVGLVIGITVVVYIQDSISWLIGFAIPTGLMVLSIILFFLGTKYYVYVPPEGSVFSGIAQVFVAAVKKRSLQLPTIDEVEAQEKILYNPNNKSSTVMKLPLTLQFRSLNKAAIPCEGEVAADGTPTNKWRLCSIQQIEEVKCLLRIVPIWASGIICFVALGQQWTFAVLQSLTMDRHLGPHFEIPAGTLGAIALLALCIFIPIYDQLLVPIARRFTGIESGITLLQRQGIGMVIAVFSMIVAGLVEEKRRSSAIAHGGTSPLTALWLAPQLVLMGVAEGFNAVGQIEFYNRQFPEHMQTLAGSLFYCSLAGASYMSSALIAVMHKNTSWLTDDINLGRVDYFYYVIAMMGVINLIYFIVCSHFYRYKGSPEVMTEVKVVGEEVELTGTKI